MLAGENPVRFLLNLPERDLLRAANESAILERVAARLSEHGAPTSSDPLSASSSSGPVAFFCAEFGVHQSLPVYSGGLGVLAGDFLKETSTRRSTSWRWTALPPRLSAPADEP